MTITLAVMMILGILPDSALSASDKAQADDARKKPLQRCDELKDKAELDCLNQARERIVEARKKRESSAVSKSGAAAEPSKSK